MNTFLGSTNAPTATIREDTDTTGLTSSGILYYFYIDNAEMKELKISSMIGIPPGEALAFLWDKTTGILTGTVNIIEI